MDETNQSAATALFEGLSAANESVTSMSDKLLQLSGELTSVVLTPDGTQLIEGTSEAESSGWEATGIRLLCLSKPSKSSSVAAKGTLDILTSGVGAITGLATTAWHLVIQSKILAMPRLVGGEVSAYDPNEERQLLVVLEAKYFARPLKKLDTNLHVSSVWRAVVPRADVAGILSWVHMVYSTALIRTNAGSLGSVS